MGDATNNGGGIRFGRPFRPSLYCNRVSATIPGRMLLRGDVLGLPFGLALGLRTGPWLGPPEAVDDPVLLDASVSVSVSAPKDEVPDGDV